MKKSTLIGLFAAVTLSAPVLTQADTFSVAVNITDLQSALALTETTAMKMPTIVIDGSKSNGQTCYSYTTSSSPLCADAVPGTDKNNAAFSIVGTPLDTVSITYIAPANKNGLSLNVWGDASLVLDAAGAGSFETKAYLTLVDIDAVQSSTSFDYEVVISYS